MPPGWTNRHRRALSQCADSTGPRAGQLPCKNLDFLAEIPLAGFSRQHTLYISNINYATTIKETLLEPVLYLAGSNLNGGSWSAGDSAVVSTRRLA